MHPIPVDGTPTLPDVARAGEEQRRSGWSAVGRMARLVWRVDRRGVSGTILFACLSALSGVGVVFVGQVALTALLHTSSGSGGGGALVLALVLLAAVTTIGSTVGVLQTQRQRVLAELVSQEIWRRVTRRVVAGRLLDYEETGFSTELERVTQNSVGRPYLVTVGLLGLLSGTIGVASLAAALLSIHPLLLAVLLIGGVPTLLIGRRASRTEFAFVDVVTKPHRRRDYLRALLHARRYAAERIALASDGLLLQRHAELDAFFLAALRRQARRREKYGLVSALSTGLSLALALLCILYLVRVGAISVPQAGAAALAVRLLSGQLGSLYGSIGQLQESMPFLADLERFTKVDPAPRPVGQRLELRSGYRLDGVGFRYPDQSAWAVQDVSLELRPGQVIAVVGENGSGKTTLAKMVAGLYPPTRGSIVWDGRADIRPEDVQRSVSVVLQDYPRYQFSVADNVRIGEPLAPPNDAGIDRALELAGAAEFVRDLPEGWETMLGRDLDEGTDLSGGQWQRLALARALYRDAPVMVLDEPSAALDPRAEHQLFDDVRRILHGRAALLISHRYLSVRLADEIIVMHEGRVVERGTHQELMALDGRYAELFRIQSAAFSIGKSSEVQG